MQTVTTIGLDIAKSVFQVHGIDAAGMRQHGPAALIEGRRTVKWHAPLRAVDFGAAVATPADPDDLERTRNEPPSGFARPAGAACCWCGVAIADFVVTHARPLAESLLAEADCRLFVLGKELGETVIAHVERPTWTWPTR
jgi:hypothetical protein